MQKKPRAARAPVAWMTLIRSVLGPILPLAHAGIIVLLILIVVQAEQSNREQHRLRVSCESMGADSPLSIKL